MIDSDCRASIKILSPSPPDYAEDLLASLIRRYKEDREGLSKCIDDIKATLPEPLTSDIQQAEKDVAIRGYVSRFGPL